MDCISRSLTALALAFIAFIGTISFHILHRESYLLLTAALHKLNNYWCPGPDPVTGHQFYQRKTSETDVKSVCTPIHTHTHSHPEKQPRIRAGKIIQRRRAMQTVQHIVAV